MWQSVLDFVSLLSDPLGNGFIVRALLSAILVGTLCAVVGSYLVVRRLSLLGLMVSNAVVPGIAVAFLLYVNIFIGGFISGILATISLGWLQAKTRIKEDAAMGIVLSAFFGFGIILITEIQNQRKVNLIDFLFGNILGITDYDLIVSAGIGVVVLIAVWALFKEFLLLSFDPEWAEATGLPALRLHYTMMALTALTVVATMQAVGVALTVALLIIPAATAYLLTNRLTAMMQLAIGLGVFSSVSGIYVSYYQNLPPGPSITLVASVLFVLALIFKPIRERFLRPKPEAPAEVDEPVPVQALEPAPTERIQIGRDSAGRLIIQPAKPGPSPGEP